MTENDSDIIIEGEVVENKWFISAINGNLDELRKTKENAGRKDDSGCTALMYCANLGHIECVKYIVEKIPAELKLQDNNGNTALMYAAMAGQLESVKLLAVYEKGMKNKENKTAYNLAVENEYVECIKLLEKLEGVHSSDTSNDENESEKNLRKDLDKLEKANKDMDKLVEQQKTRGNSGSYGF